MINKLVNLANELDQRGLMKEADYLDSIIIKIANPTFEYTVRKGDEAGELALMSLGDADRFREINEGRPLRVGSVIDLPYLPERAGTTRTNPKTGRQLVIPDSEEDAVSSRYNSTWTMGELREEAKRQHRRCQGDGWWKDIEEACIAEAEAEAAYQARRAEDQANYAARMERQRQENPPKTITSTKAGDALAVTWNGPITARQVWKDPKFAQSVIDFNKRVVEKKTPDWLKIDDPRDRNISFRGVPKTIDDDINNQYMHWEARGSCDVTRGAGRGDWGRGPNTERTEQVSSTIYYKKNIFHMPAIARFPGNTTSAGFSALKEISVDEEDRWTRGGTEVKEVCGW